MCINVFIVWVMGVRVKSVSFFIQFHSFLLSLFPSTDTAEQFNNILIARLVGYNLQHQNT